MKKISFFVALVFLIASVNLVMAGSPGRGGTMGPECEMDASVLSNLNLTMEQNEKVRALRESHMKSMAPIRTKLFNKKAELRLLWMQIKADPSEIVAKQKEIHNLKGQLQEKTTDYRLSFRNILTQEQLTEFIAGGYGKGHSYHGKWKRDHHKGIGQKSRCK